MTAASGDAPELGPDGYFGQRVAARYDASLGERGEPAVVDPAVDLLAELAGDGRALEFGVGTGRIALPLAARGVPVHGIELSRAMVAELQAKPGADAIGVTVGDFATARVDGTFSVAYLVINTTTNLTTQAAQGRHASATSPPTWTRRLLRRKPSLYPLSDEGGGRQGARPAPAAAGRCWCLRTTPSPA